jgi:hypothetical protein
MRLLQGANLRSVDEQTTARLLLLQEKWIGAAQAILPDLLKKAIEQGCIHFVLEF